MRIGPGQRIFRATPSAVRLSLCSGLGRALRRIPYFKLGVASGVRDTELTIQTRCKQNNRSADSARVRAGSVRQRGSEPELCFVAGIPAMVDRSPLLHRKPR
jgi:hypothetical protein